MKCFGRIEEHFVMLFIYVLKISLLMLASEQIHYINILRKYFVYRQLPNKLLRMVDFLQTTF